MSDPREPAVQQALARLAELVPRQPATGSSSFAAVRDLLVPLLTASPYLTRFLLAHPEALSEVRELPAARDKAAWLTFLAKRAPLTDSEGRFAERLRVARHEAFVGLATQELVTGDPLATGAGLSLLAKAVLEHALAYAQGLMQSRYGAPFLADGAPCGAVVIAMGKLGGDELNFSSDIDLLYAYTSDQGRTDGARGLGASIDLHMYHSRLFAKLTQLIADQGEEGLVFRVDLDQRPEGRTGPLCNSAEALERYYESFGHDAERLAWVKAQPVAGDLALGQRIVASLEPFVFRRHLDYAFAEDLLAMKRRIDQSSARLGQKPGFNVKLGRGGLREIEFFVQALQLAWGGRLPDLRARDTLTALQRIALAGLVDQTEADALVGAYRFLRRIEHLLQLEEDRQTHVLPADPAERRRIAGLVSPGEGDPLARFEAALDDHRKHVRAAFEAVVAGAEEDRGRATPEQPEPGSPFALMPGASFESATDARIALAIDFEVEPEAREEALAALGFLRPESARNRLEGLSRRPDSPFHPSHVGGAHGALSRLARKIMLAVTQTPDPDAALSHVDALLRALRHRQAALEQLDEDPRRLRALANLFGTSHFLSRLLVRSPGLLDRLVLDGKEPSVRSRHDMGRLFANELAAVVAGNAEAASVEDFLVAARRFQTAEVLRIGFFDLAGLIEDPAEQLSDLAEVIVLGLAASVRAELAAKMGKSDVIAPLAVVALGAFGARELGYHSELELAFVVSAGADPALALRMSRAIVTALSVSTVEGSLYRLDTRQRPTGSHGPLSVTAARWREHHFGRAAEWEHETVLHARVLGEADPALVATVAELSAHASESLAQSPNASPPAALAGLARAGLVPAAEARALAESRRFLRRLDNRLAIVQEVGAESHVLLAADPAAWGASDRDHMRRLALRMGYGDASGRGGGDAALALYKDVQRHRKVVADVAVKLSHLREPRLNAPDA